MITFCCRKKSKYLEEVNVKPPIFVKVTLMELLHHKQSNDLHDEDHDKNENVKKLKTENGCQDSPNEHYPQVHNGDANKNIDVVSKNLIGVNFYSKWYSTYLSSSHLTDETDLFVATDNMVLVSTSSKGTSCSLSVLRDLSTRTGFTNCSG